MGTTRRALAGALFVLVPAATALAQDFPARPVRVIIPLSAGSLTDTMFRVLAPMMSANLGASVVVDNMPGAAGLVGTVAGAKAAPDGYTLLMAVSSAFSVNPHVNKDLPYHPVRDFAPVCRLGGGTNVLVVNPSIGIRSFAELMARANSTTVTFASGGVGTTGHLAQELFKSRVGGQWLHVPYKGTAPAVTDTVAGHAQVMMEVPGPLLGHIQSGKLIALGVMNPTRSPTLPDIPTFGELGYDGLVLQGWVGLVAPINTPAPVVSRLDAACKGAMDQAEFANQARIRGFDVSYAGPAAFSEYIAQELPRWGQLVRMAGLKQE